VHALQAALEQDRDRYNEAAKARVAQFRWQDVADKYLEVLLALREQTS
jgi:glycosyltransferase involved in cell wall biosynthesis